MSEGVPNTPSKVAPENIIYVSEADRLSTKPKAYLTVLPKHGKTKTSTLCFLIEPKKEILFGRDPSCFVQFKQACVSRRHAKIEVDEDLVCYLNPIAFAKSGNYTYLQYPDEMEAFPLTHIEEVKNGDTIIIGERCIRFEREEEVQPESKPAPVVEAPLESLKSPKKSLASPIKAEAKMQPPSPSQTRTIMTFKTPVKSAIVLREMASTVKSSRRKSVSFARKLEEALSYRPEDASEQVYHDKIKMTPAKNVNDREYKTETIPLLSFEDLQPDSTTEFNYESLSIATTQEVRPETQADSAQPTPSQSTKKEQKKQKKQKKSKEEQQAPPALVDPPAAESAKNTTPAPATAIEEVEEETAIIAVPPETPKPATPSRKAKLRRPKITVVPVIKQESNTVQESKPAAAATNDQKESSPANKEPAPVQDFASATQAERPETAPQSHKTPQKRLTMVRSRKTRMHLKAKLTVQEQRPTTPRKVNVLEAESEPAQKQLSTASPRKKEQHKESNKENEETRSKQQQRTVSADTIIAEKLAESNKAESKTVVRSRKNKVKH